MRNMISRRKRYSNTINKKNDFFEKKNIFGLFWANLWVGKCRFSKLLPTFTLKLSKPRLLNSPESKSGRQKIIKSWI